MRIIYDNYLQDSTLSATNENLNKPVTNLIHNYLELEFKATANNSVITITFDSPQAIDAFCYGYHNLSAMTLTFYDSGLNNLGNLSVTLESNEDVVYLEEESSIDFSDIKKIEVTITTAETYVYLGSIFVSQFYQMPNFRMGLTGVKKINDSITKSPGGQVSGNKMTDLNQWSIIFSYITNIQKNTILSYIKIVKLSTGHYIDLYEAAHDYFLPFYGHVINNEIELSKRRISDWEWDLSIDYEEAR